jgi:tryptophan-rich sensory protein
MPTARHRSSVLPSIRHLLPTALATAATAVAGSVATRRSVRSSWYEGLDKPPFQPPGWLFPVAWTALYTDIAVTTAKALDVLPAPERTGLHRALGVNLALNAGWSWAFFGSRNVALSVPVAAALAVSSADLARRVGRAEPAYGLSLAPYPAWCTFATVLSAAIARRNPGA